MDFKITVIKKVTVTHLFKKIDDNMENFTGELESI